MVILAKQWNPTKIDYSGWYASIKQDGYRAIWTGGYLQSRNGIYYNTPKWFTRYFPINVSLDGELFIPGATFEEHGALRRSNSTDQIWKRVEFHVFDIPKSNKQFKQNYKKLQKFDNHGPIRVLHQQKVHDNVHARRLADDIISGGGEGLMLRNPASIYVDKRTSDLVKIKDVRRASAVIVGHTSGKGRNWNLVGAYVCRFINEDSKHSSDDNRSLTNTFKVGNLSDDMRNTPLKVGTIIDVLYQSLTRKNTPRFPRML